jgi:exodeoxyribonuclease VII large subunit
MASRAIELNEKGDELVVQFAYRAELVQVVRGLSRRRFDPIGKFWTAPVETVVEVVEALLDHGFVVSAAVRELYLQRGGKAFEGRAEVATASVPSDSRSSHSVDGAGAALLTDRPAAKEPTSLTVSELNARVHRVLARSFPEMLWVVGEIAGFDRNRHRPHVHFQLMEKAGEPTAGSSGAGPSPASPSGDGAILASVDAVLFARTRRELERKLASCDAPFELRDGIEVRVGVRVDLYEAKGAFQLVVEEIDPVHTLGRIAQQRAAVLAELEKRGLREKNASLPWPEVPLRVGLVTSVGSDAYNDFVNELARSGYAFETTAVDARMQGEGLERGVVAALAWFGERAADFDVVAIVRGGGAKTDLTWFDRLPVAVAVAQCPVKVVSGIGHQRDVSVVDLISHSEKTPTAAAAAIVARVHSFEARLADAFERLAASVRDFVESERARVRRCVRELLTAAREVARVEQARLRAAFARVAPATRERLRAARRAVAEARVRLVSLGRAQARLQSSALATLRRRLDPAAMRLHLDRRAAKLASLEQLAQSFHPRRTLQRGFAIVRDERGRTLRDAASVARGGVVEATLARGRLKARVEDVAAERPDGGGA